MALNQPRITDALAHDDAARLGRALSGAHDVTVFVDGTVYRLPAGARESVIDLLTRLSDGDAVSVSSIEELLSTSQAAELAGISHTYLRNMTDRGEIPVQYRGTHRRIRRSDIVAWLATQSTTGRKVGEDSQPAATSASASQP